MFGSVGVPELVIILTIALLVFGPRKLPELGASLGKTIKEFKRAASELQERVDTEIQIEQRQSRAAVPPAPRHHES
jgi:sec-independent protein translocase protein TatA